MNNQKGDGALAWTIAQTCARLNVGKTKGFELLEWGFLDSFCIGHRRLVTDSSILRLIAELQLVDRINRAFAQQGKSQHVEMQNSRRRYHGRYFILDNADKIISPDVDLTALASSLGMIEKDVRIAAVADAA